MCSNIHSQDESGLYIALKCIKDAEMKMPLDLIFIVDIFRTRIYLKIKLNKLQMIQLIGK